jgi:hypothetical protein
VWVWVRPYWSEMTQCVGTHTHTHTHTHLGEALVRHVLRPLGGVLRFVFGRRLVVAQDEVSNKILNKVRRFSLHHVGRGHVDPSQPRQRRAHPAPRARRKMCAHLTTRARLSAATSGSA